MFERVYKFCSISLTIYFDIAKFGVFQFSSLDFLFVTKHNRIGQFSYQDFFPKWFLLSRFNLGLITSQLKSRSFNKSSSIYELQLSPE